MIFITKTIKIELTDKEKLLFACADGDLEEAKRLLSTGLNVNVTDRYGHSLLWLACSRNQTEVVRHLLSQPAINFNQKDKPLYSILNDKRTDLSLCKDDFLQLKKFGVVGLTDQGYYGKGFLFLFLFFLTTN